MLVSKDQSRLAFGKKAQNVRLSSKLTGWKFNIQTLEEDAEEAESVEVKIEHAAEGLADALGIEQRIALALVNGGFLSVEGLHEADSDTLESIEGLSPEDLAELMSKLDNE